MIKLAVVVIIFCYSDSFHLTSNKKNQGYGINNIDSTEKQVLSSTTKIFSRSLTALKCLSSSHYNDMTVKELKEELKNKGMTVTGVKK